MLEPANPHRPSETCVRCARQPWLEQDVIPRTEVMPVTCDLKRASAYSAVDSWMRTQVTKRAFGYQGVLAQQALNFMLKFKFVWSPSAFVHCVRADVVFELVESILMGIYCASHRVGEEP